MQSTIAKTRELKNCLFCSKELSHKQQIRKNRFCTIDCWNKAGKPTEKIELHQCRHCDKTYKPIRNGLHFCSKICEQESARATSVSIIITDLTKYRICECGKEFYATASQKSCSTECQQERLKRQQREAYYRSTEGLEPATKEGTCKRCGKDFKNKFGEKKKLFCSRKCLRKEGRISRKIQKRTAYVEPVTIEYLIERDNSRCQLCFKKVKVKETVPHSKAPTIDHIIPISLGGVHSKQNTRLAHFKCNSARGNREPAQLRLFG